MVVQVGSRRGGGEGDAPDIGIDVTAIQLHLGVEALHLAISWKKQDHIVNVATAQARRDEEVLPVHGAQPYNKHNKNVLGENANHAQRGAEVRHVKDP